MIPVRQRQRGLGGEVEVTHENLHLLGDCTKCAVASILERDYDDVPHFTALSATTNYHWTRFLNDWLAEEGYPFRYAEWYVEVDSGRVPRFPGWWIGLVRSKTLKDSNHAIVCRDAEIVFDPSVNAGKPEYDALPYRFIGIGYFQVTEPQLIRPRSVA